MKTDNIVQVKSYAFAVEIVKLCQELQKEHEYVLSKQILRSGTAIGALVEEAIGAQSDKDFYHKLTISYKEARETKYWLRLLIDTNYITKPQGAPFLDQIEEILRIVGSIRKTLEKRLYSNRQLRK